MTPAKASAALQLTGIDKRFGDSIALRHADLVLEPGVLHAVVGENGAGKSTLLRIAAGLLAADHGSLVAFGTTPSPYDANVAQSLGIVMVQQHFALFEGLTVLENLILGAEPTRAFGRLDRARAERDARRVADALGFTVSLSAKVATLGVAEKQRLEIARALYRDARVIILDEPTAVLAPVETGALYAILRWLVGQGRSVVVVTHKLEEVDAYADVVTVMRRGEVLESRPVRRGTEVARLAGALVGGEAPEPLEPSAHPLGPVVLALEGVRVGRTLNALSLEVRSGEIVGVAGVSGNGQAELVHLLGGLLEPDAGEVRTESLEVVHEDRQTEGLVLGASVRENLVLGELASFTRFGVVDDGRVEAEAVQRVARFGIQPSDPDALASALSGGNQQKIVVARALAREPRVLVIAHATRGVDAIAARAIHERILEAAARGMGILLIGADLGELRLLSTRILVLVRGRVVADLPPTVNDAALGAAMLGGDGAAA